MPRKRSSSLSPTEREVLIYIGRGRTDGRRVGGYGMAPYLRAARTLAIRGLVMESGQSWFTLTDAGRLFAEKLERKRLEEQKKARKRRAKKETP